MSFKEKIVEMLKSGDIEMVRLGATLLQRLPRKTWTPLLRDCKQNWYFIVNHNRITIYDQIPEVIPSIIGHTASTPATYSTTHSGGTTVVTYTNSSSWSWGYDLYSSDLSKDLDEEREARRLTRNKLAERQKQKQHIYEEKWKGRRLNQAFRRTGRNAHASR